MNQKVTVARFFLAAMLFVLACPGIPSANEFSTDGPVQDDSASPAFFDEVREGFSHMFKIVGGFNMLKSNPPSDGVRYSFDGELRPDFFLDYKRLRLVARPRIRLTWQHFEGESEDDVDFFVREWLAALNVTRELYLSYGRENLQWGPSYLFSPSNPFFKSNFSTKPLSELPGLDLGRLIWFTHPAWTLSLIANTGEGQVDFPFGFERTYALKLDYTGDRKYFSLIPSIREGDRPRLGGYAGWTLTNALILHTEFEFSFEMNPAYELSQLKTYQPYDPRVMGPKADVDQYTDHEIDTTLLLGGAYTFEMGSTLIMEYIYNGAGLDDPMADQFLRTLRTLGSAQLETLVPEARLFRKNYLMLQYQHIQIKDVLSVVFRYLFNFDDQSSRLTSVVGLSVGAHTRLFLTGNKNFGSDDAEFPLAFDYNVTAGLEYVF